VKIKMVEVKIKYGNYEYRWFTNAYRVDILKINNSEYIPISHYYLVASKGLNPLFDDFWDSLPLKEDVEYDKYCKDADNDE
jgi:hypothetical protein